MQHVALWVVYLRDVGNLCVAIAPLLPMPCQAWVASGGYALIALAHVLDGL